MNHTEKINKAALIARYSLAFVWISTAVVSVIISPQIGLEILSDAGVTEQVSIFLIYAGSLLDATLGIWLLSGKATRLCYLLQFLVIFGYSLLLSLLAPSFWLHPFAPVIKNVPILALIFLLYQIQLNQIQHTKISTRD